MRPRPTARSSHTVHVQSGLGTSSNDCFMSVQLPSWAARSLQRPPRCEAHRRPEAFSVMGEDRRSRARRISP